MGEMQQEHEIIVKRSLAGANRPLGLVDATELLPQELHVAAGLGNIRSARKIPFDMRALPVRVTDDRAGHVVGCETGREDDPPPLTGEVARGRPLDRLARLPFTPARGAVQQERGR